VRRNGWFLVERIVHADVDRRRRLRDAAHGNEIDASFGNFADRIEPNASRSFERHPARDKVYCLSKRGRVHIVEEQAVGACSQSFLDLLDAIDLDLDLQARVGFLCGAYGRSDAAGDCDVIVLDQDSILVTHHPLFALQVGDRMTPAVGRSELALDAVGDAGVDLLLAGHNHQASIHSARDLVTRAGPALVIQAGTATSTRVRDQDQSFNRIEVDGPNVTVAVESWNGSDFVAKDAQRFEQHEGQWRIAQPAEAD
jgi:hypothetical protein